MAAELEGKHDTYLGARRMSIEIIESILSALGRHHKKTRIMYAANLNHTMAARYLADLEAWGFVARDGEESTHFFITDEGARFHADLRRALEHIPGQ